jgi:predicted ArsR family transcriptional regulator
MKVGLRILEHDDVDDDYAYFSELIEELKGIVSRVTIHEALDNLIDQGAVRSQWVQTQEGRWVRGYRAASESQRRLLRRAYLATHD